MGRQFCAACKQWTGGFRFHCQHCHRMLWSKWEMAAYFVFVFIGGIALLGLTIYYSLSYVAEFIGSK